VVGNARSIVSEFDVYQKELARLVTNVTKLYDVTSTLPAYAPDPSTIRVLHVSDIHLNPASWKIIASLVKQYKIDVIVDSGDTMDHGTAAENGFLDPASDLGAPYVWVRGNHDGRVTQDYLERMKNVHVLDDGRAVSVAGLRFAGVGDPQFTPDRTAKLGGDQSEVLAGARLASSLRDQKAAGTPVDIAVAHNPTAARQTDGDVPLVLAGHLHHQEMEVLKYGTRLRIEGSTGGSGLRALEGEDPARSRRRSSTSTATPAASRPGTRSNSAASASPRPRSAATSPRRTGRAPSPPRPPRPQPLRPLPHPPRKPFPNPPRKPFWRSLPTSHMLLTSPTRCKAPRRADSPHRLAA
jgi:predicted MPP superfamily phosphohydrolase